MDRWLTAVERDHSSTALPQKIIDDKPSDLTDECWDGTGQKLSNTLCPAGVVNVEGTPRTVAGDAITTDANKCQLKPLSRSDYPGITFTDAAVGAAPEDVPRPGCATTQSRASTSSRRSRG